MIELVARVVLVDPCVAANMSENGELWGLGATARSVLLRSSWKGPRRMSYTWVTCKIVPQPKLGFGAKKACTAKPTPDTLECVPLIPHPNPNNRRDSRSSQRSPSNQPHPLSRRHCR
jgi:hypothetical protein